MKIPLLLYLFLLSAIPAHSQTHLLGIKGGYSATNVDMESGNGNAPLHRNGFTAGIAYEQLSESGFSFLADLLYSQRGFKIDYGFIIPNGAGTLASGVLKTYDYISMPLRIGGNFGSRSYCFASAGFVPAVLIRAETHHLIYDKNGDVLKRNIVDFTRQANLLDVAGIAELGVGYRFNRGSRVFGTVSYQQSLTNANNTGSSNGGSIKHYGLTVALGFKWALLKEVSASTKPIVEE